MRWQDKKNAKRYQRIDRELGDRHQGGGSLAADLFKVILALIWLALVGTLKLIGSLVFGRR